MNLNFREAGASLDPEGKGGRANMVSALLDEGAGDLGSQAFQRQLENQSIQLSFNAGQDSFGGSLKTLNKYRDSAIKLTALALTEPRFDKDAVERIRAQILTGLKSRSSRPGYIASRVWSKAIYGKHAYARPITGTQKSVEGLSVVEIVRSGSFRAPAYRQRGWRHDGEQLNPCWKSFRRGAGKSTETKIQNANLRSKGALIVVKRYSAKRGHVRTKKA